MADNTPEQFDDTPRGQKARWAAEIKSAKKRVEEWHSQAKEALDAYNQRRDSDKATERRLGLFHSDVELWHASLFGNVPRSDVVRRFQDANDNIARVGGEMKERILNTDIERDSDSYVSALDNCLRDWRIVGLGWARARYEVEFGEPQTTPAKTDPVTGEVLAPEITVTPKTYECVDIEYVHWRDVLWGPGRTWKDVPWVAYRIELSRTDLVKEFGEELGSQIPLNAKKAGGDESKETPWDRAELWEIWDRDGEQTLVLSEAYPEIIRTTPDALRLETFYSCPKPLIANPTTEAVIPTPDYWKARDLYRATDTLFHRISKLEEALRVVGMYDKASGAVKRVLRDGAENEMIPVENWAMFAEKGGIKGAVDWFPVEQVAGALATLTERLNEKIQLLQQVTGTADLMRGQAQQAATATERSIQAGFASVRAERQQKEFARFASDLLAKKGEIVANCFDVQTIVNQANMANSPDAAVAPQAAQFIKDRFSEFRIEVKPEAVNFQDMAQIRSERTAGLQALSSAFSSMGPIAQSMPGSTPMLLEIVKWFMQGFKGFSSIEGVLDQTIAQSVQQLQQQAAQPKPPPPPDPKVVAAQIKAQSDQQKGQLELQKIQLEHQADLQHIAAEHQADLARIDKDTQVEVAKMNAQAVFGAREELARAHIRKAVAPTVPTTPGVE